MGADVVIGSVLSAFGVPMGYGGPHAAFMATKEKHKRTMPGRVIGVSIDTRKAIKLCEWQCKLVSNISAVKKQRRISVLLKHLLANMASFFAVYHGEEGLRTIARRTHHMTAILAAGLTKSGYELAHNSFFDTLTINTGDKSQMNCTQKAQSSRHQPAPNLNRSDWVLVLMKPRPLPILNALFAVFDV